MFQNIKAITSKKLENPYYFTDFQQAKYTFLDLRKNVFRTVIFALKLEVIL